VVLCREYPTFSFGILSGTISYEESIFEYAQVLTPVGAYCRVVKEVGNWKTYLAPSSNGFVPGTSFDNNS